jgi:TRAP-type C4-dicarboxylate transport system permease small subunit
MAGDRVDGVVPDIPPRLRRTMSVVALVCAVAAVWLFVTGVVGMVLGTLAHAKGDRLGLPAAFAAGIAMIVGMALVFFGRQ